MDFKELREKSGLSVAEFSRQLNIPYRTVQNWEYGQTKCPDYVIDLMAYKLGIDNKIFVIYRDSPNDLCEMKGYIVGTPEDAYEYCKEQNKDCENYSDAVDFEEIKNLHFSRE